jgi:AcrR family transcriptional regulator
VSASPRISIDLAPAAPAESAAGYAKSRDTRARILAAALDEAGAHGFQKTSAAGIAARAGVAVGSVNYHFGSRAELIRELMGLLIADYLERVRAAEATAVEQGGDYFTRERAILLAYVAHVRRHPAYVRLADEIKLHEPELYRRGAEYWAERAAVRIRQGVAEGALRTMDDSEIRLKARFLLGARHYLEQGIEGTDAVSDEELVDAYLDLVANGLGRSRSLDAAAGIDTGKEAQT